MRTSQQLTRLVAETVEDMLTRNKIIANRNRGLVGGRVFSREVPLLVSSFDSTKTPTMNKSKEHIRYIAAVQQPHGENCFQPLSAATFPEEDLDKIQIQKFAAYKLKKINQVS